MQTWNWLPPIPYPLKDLCKVNLVLLAIEDLTACPSSPLDYANTILPGMRYRPRHHPHITMERPIIPPLILLRWTLFVEDSMLGTVRHALKVSICPHTRSDDLLIVMRPILHHLATIPDSNGVILRPINRIDEMFYATTVSRPSHHPQFIVITIFEETIRDCLISELADDELFGVRLEPEIASPGLRPLYS